MIYRIKSDDNILYDLRDKEYFVEDPVLNLEINKVGSLTFTIYPDHPNFDKLIKLVSNIRVYRDDKILFKGRVISDIPDIYNRKEIECESSLAYFNDSIVRPGEFKGSTSTFFEFIINNHNLQVSEHQKLKMGQVTVTDNNDYITRSWEDYMSTWDLIKTRCLDLIGGYLVERYETDGTYIDWLEDFDKVSEQSIVFGENLLDIIVKNDASNTYSVIIPLGAKTDKTEISSKRLTISDVNNGKDYLINEAALEKYGWIVAPTKDTTWDDITLPQNLKAKGEAYLNNVAGRITSSLELTALDLSATSINIEAFFIYEYVNIFSKPHGYNNSLLLKKINIPLAHPEDTKISLGEISKTLTGISFGGNKDITSIAKRVENIEADYISSNNLGQNIDSVIENNEIIKSIPEMYVLKSDFDDFVSEINKRIDELAANDNPIPEESN